MAPGHRTLVIGDDDDTKLSVEKTKSGYQLENSGTLEQEGDSVIISMTIFDLLRSLS